MRYAGMPRDHALGLVTTHDNLPSNLHSNTLQIPSIAAVCLPVVRVLPTLDVARPAENPISLLSTVVRQLHSAATSAAPHHPFLYYRYYTVDTILVRPRHILGRKNYSRCLAFLRICCRESTYPTTSSNRFSCSATARALNVHC